MDAVLKFSLPDDQIEYEAAYHGARYKTVLQKFDQELRNTIKHETIPDIHHYITIREILRVLCQEEEVTLY